MYGRYAYGELSWGQGENERRADTLNNIVGTTSLAFTLTGDLEDGATGSIAGIAALTFTVSGDLLGRADGEGVATGLFTASGDLTAIAYLDGVSTVTFTPSGNLTSPVLYTTERALPAEITTDLTIGA